MCDCLPAVARTSLNAANGVERMDVLFHSTFCREFLFGFFFVVFVNVVTLFSCFCERFKVNLFINKKQIICLSWGRNVCGLNCWIEYMRYDKVHTIPSSSAHVRIFRSSENCRQQRRLERNFYIFYFCPSCNFLRTSLGHQQWDSPLATRTTRLYIMMQQSI